MGSFLSNNSMLKDIKYSCKYVCTTYEKYEIDKYGNAEYDIFEELFTAL